MGLYDFLGERFNGYSICIFSEEGRNILNMQRDHTNDDYHSPPNSRNNSTSTSTSNNNNDNHHHMGNELWLSLDLGEGRSAQVDSFLVSSLNGLGINR